MSYYKWGRGASLRMLRAEAFAQFFDLSAWNSISSMVGASRLFMSECLDYNNYMETLGYNSIFVFSRIVNPEQRS